MTDREFCYWLRGYFELNEGGGLSTRQIEIVVDHLNLVFEKKTPDRPNIVGFDLSTMQMGTGIVPIGAEVVYDSTIPWTGLPLVNKIPPGSC